MSQIPVEIRDALRAVLDYAQPDEERDARDQEHDNHEGHVVVPMRLLRRWLDDNSAVELNTEVQK